MNENYPSAVLKAAQNIKLLLLDVDGVLTDGRLHYGNSGEELKAFDIHLKEIAFIGDDLPDLAVIRSVGLGITPANGNPFLVSHALWQTRKSGGNGSVREVAELILSAQGKLESLLAPYL